MNGNSVAGTGLEIFSGQSVKGPAPTSSGAGVSEILRGNGSRLGYKLSHGNVIATTVRVRTGGQSLRLDADFWIDIASGSLIFAQPVRQSDSISVYYRYLDGPATTASGLAMPGLQLAFGQGGSLGLMYNTLAGDGSGMDTSLYGLSLGGKLGGNGLAQFSGLAFFSNTQKSSNLVLTPGSNAAAPKPGARDERVGLDHLLTQNFQVNSGKLQFHADYQDVGKNFAGFQALKLSNANNKPMLDQLTALEGEKGVRRLGFGLNLLDKVASKTPGGLAMQWNRIEDGKGSITQESFGYHAGGLRFDYGIRAIAANFGSFKGLREADRAQWEREKGLKTTSMGLGLDFGGTKKGAPAGGFGLVSQSFKDASGALTRDLFNFKAGSAAFTYMNRKSTAGFKRLNDLSDADKTQFALDLYHEFDPTARPEQVTAADRAQVAREAGLSKSALRFDDAFGKSAGVSYSRISVANRAAPDKNAATAKRAEALERNSFALATSQFTLNYTARRIDAGFSRLADLADIEKNNLALDTRRMYDPAAALAQVTQKDRDQLTKEAGIARSNLRGQWLIGKAGKAGSFSFSQYRIGDTAAPGAAAVPGDSISGMTVAFTSRSLQLSYYGKTVGSGFARLGDLSDIDRAQFANARGLSQSGLAGNLQINKSTKVTFSTLSIAGTRDSVTAAAADALQNNKDVSAAVKSARSGLERLNVGFEAPGLTFALGQSNTDREFSRSSDLPLTNPDKQQIEAERGTSRRNYNLHFARVKGMLIDANLYDAADAQKNRDHRVDKIDAQYAVNKKSLLSFQTDTDLTTLEGKKTGRDHTTLGLNQEIGKNFLLNLLHDARAIYDNNTATPDSATTNSLHFETPRTLKNGLNFDVKRVAYLDGRYENTSNLNLHAKPTQTLSLNFTRQEIDRGEGKPEAGQTATAPTTPSAAAVSESTDTVDAQWQATKQFAVVFGLTQRDATDNGNNDSVSVGLQGQPSKDVTLLAKFDEVHVDGKNTKDVADFAISNTRPFKIGCISDLTITARYASLNDQKKLQNETMTGRAAWKICKNEFVLDYGGLTKQNGEVTISRLYSFTTDPNPKKWFHGGFYYKARTMADGTEKLIRRFTADWRLSRATSFEYTYGTLPEDDKGNILPQITANLSLKHSLRKDLAFEAFYRRFDDATTKKLTRGIGLGLDGKLDKITKFSVAYSLETNGDVARYDRSHHYHFLLDRQVDADHFLTLSTEWRTHDAKDLKDEIQANLDIRVVF